MDALAPAPTPSASTAPSQLLEGPLGYHEIPEPVAEQVVDLNSKGLEKHRGQDFEASRHDFERALLRGPRLGRDHAGGHQAGLRSGQAAARVKMALVVLRDVRPHIAKQTEGALELLEKAEEAVPWIRLPE